MLKLIRSFFRNEKFIFEIMCIIIFIIVFLHIINDQASNQKSEYINTNTISKNVEEKDTETYKQLIEKFITLGKDKKYEEAYELLSDECKNVIFNNDINNFKEKYYKRYLVGLDKYYINLYEQNEEVIIYSIIYYPNALETGKTDSEEEYISIVVDDKNTNNLKLNVLGFNEVKNINV